MILYLVTKQYYEEVCVYGVFTAEELDKALTELAQTYKHMTEAEDNAQEERDWYNYHLDYYKDKCKYGCGHMPHSMHVPILAHSKSLFRITMVELNKPKPEGKCIE